jgi:hypothetical protein
MLYPGERAMNLIPGEACPKLGSKFKGSFKYDSSMLWRNPSHGRPLTELLTGVPPIAIAKAHTKPAIDGDIFIRPSRRWTDNGGA